MCLDFFSTSLVWVLESAWEDGRDTSLCRKHDTSLLEQLRRNTDTHDQMSFRRVHRPILKTICHETISWHLFTHQERSSQTRTFLLRALFIRLPCTGIYMNKNNADVVFPRKGGDPKRPPCLAVVQTIAYTRGGGENPMSI